MRITFILTQDLESPSGLGRYLPIARQLIRRGHHVHISALHPNFDALQTRTQLIDGIDVKYVAAMHVRKQGNLKYYYPAGKLLTLTLKATYSLTVDAWKSGAQIIHIGKPHPMNSVSGLLSNLRLTSSLCVDCDDYEAASMSFSANWQKRLITCFEKRIPLKARLVTVNTQFMRSKLIEWGVPEGRILYLPNGVDCERFKRPEIDKIEALRKELGLEGKQVVAYIGSLSLPSHPLDLLLRAYALVNKVRPDSVLMIVGGGSDYHTLEAMASQLGLGNSVIFTGRVAPHDVVMYYHLADLTVDPVYDNDAARGRSPLKLFESWASGVPFITSRVGDRIQLLGEAQAGILAEESTPEAYSNAILTALSTPSLCASLRERGLIEVQKYTWDHLTGHLEKSYQAIHERNQVKTIE